MKPFDRLCSDLHVHLDRQESSGWYSIFCPMCGERNHRTGGFRFEDESIIYNCFRGKCDANCSMTNGEYVNKKFRALMKTMGVNIPVELLMGKKKSSLQMLLEDDSHLFEKHSYKEIEVPDFFVPFEESKRRIYKENAARYFESRMCSLDDVFVIEGGQFAGLFAFGMYFYDKLIGFNIIAENGKYISKFGGNDHILYVPEHRLQKKVIVVEGGMDAKCFPNTAATLSPSMSRQQAYLLKGRDVVFLPDRKGGNRYIDQFHQYGWSICIPDWEEKDLNEAVQKYGKLVVAKKIVDGSTKDLLTAKARYKLWTLDRKEG